MCCVAVLIAGFFDLGVHSKIEVKTGRPGSRREDLTEMTSLLPATPEARRARSRGISSPSASPSAVSDAPLVL